MLFMQIYSFFKCINADTASLSEEYWAEKLIKNLMNLDAAN